MKEIAPTRSLAIFAILVVALGALTLALNWLVDPLQYYRKASYPPEFCLQARYQNPGLARNYPYDAVIIGSSVSLGFDAPRVHDELGWNVLNLAMSGASAHEQSLLLEVALRTGRVRHVLWDINHEFMGGDPHWVSDFDGTFPAYFYDTNPWNEIPNYLLNVDTAKASARVVLRRCGLPLAHPNSLAEISRLGHNHPLGLESVLLDWRRDHIITPVFQEHPGDFTLEKLDRSFEENCVRLIAAHPEVEFDLWFPPFTIARQAKLSEIPAVWDNMFLWKADAMRAVAPYPNARLYDFQGDPNTIHGLDHYSDCMHFDDTIRTRILQAVANHTALATPDSLAATEAQVRREAPVFRAANPVK
jgi:hypothetical protein